MLLIRDPVFPDLLLIDSGLKITVVTSDIAFQNHPAGLRIGGVDTLHLAADGDLLANVGFPLRPQVLRQNVCRRISVIHLPAGASRNEEDQCQETAS